MTIDTTAKRWLIWLAGARLFWALLVLNLLATILTVASAFHINAGDHYTYLGYADGLLHGRYSYWYFFPDYIPDTFRNPGYPLFLALLKGIGIEGGGIRLVQVGLYGITIWLFIKLAQRCEHSQSWLVRNTFLLVLLPNVQLAYFAALLFPEVLVAFLIAVYATVAFSWPVGSWRRTISLALVAGALFQVRPVFLLFPLVQLALDFLYTRSRTKFAWGQAVVLLGLFGVTMVPYAAWNYRHHGVVKITPLEGGAGVMQIGFWALRMPNYHEHRYWGNQMGDEVISFVAPAEVPAAIAAFEHEWDVIDKKCQPLLTARDKQYLPIMRRDYKMLFPTYSTAYTLQREHLLMQANLADIRREPGYYLKTRLYTLVRLWVTGVQRSAWQAAATPLAKLKILYPALVSSITFLLALISAAWGIWHWQRFGENARVWWLGLAFIVYFGVMHLPFAIQARYTVPVRPWLVFFIALTFATWLSRRVGWSLAKSAE